MSSQPTDADAIAYGVFDGLEPAAGRRSLDEAVAKRRGFTGALGESMVRDTADGRLEIAVGLGKRERFDTESLRRAGAAAARAAKKCETLAIELAGLDSNGVDLDAAARAVAEGAALASYHYDRFRSKASDDGLRDLVLVDPTGEAAAAAAAAAVVAEAVTLCRDLINTPAGDLSPSDFAEIARDVAARTGLVISVFEAEQILEEEGLGGLLGVAAGSIQPPRLVRLVYEPEGVSDPTTVALVGKGITFDSGGLSIKPATSMMTMKEDMSGAAAVLATMSACGRLGVKVRVVGFMPLTENMPGGSATKPGDVLRTRNGKTIEVLNTDAEGRLVLADALSLAVEEAPDSIIDLATLTGACVVALGKQIAGLLGNDDELLASVTAAGEVAGEASWPLPIPAGYRSHIDSEVADMKNMGATGQAGTLAAALLLQEFVGSVPWAHLDIAGPAWSDEDKGYIKKGGTGFGVRTLLALLDDYRTLGREVSGDAKGIRVLR